MKNDTVLNPDIEIKEKRQIINSLLERERGERSMII